jgi:hypothetical protein
MSTEARTRAWELGALWSLGMVVIAGAIYSADISATTDTDRSQTVGIVIGGLMSVLPMIINAIRTLSQSQAMQEMASQLGKSSPVQQATTENPLPVHETGEPDETYPIGFGHTNTLGLRPEQYTKHPSTC